MTSALEKKRLDKLARVRENQRKSRARRQDHLQDLERKVLSLQQELDRRDVEHRLAVQRLEAENKRLRDLHFFLGVPPSALEEYLRMVDNPVAAQKVAIPAIRRAPSEAQSRVAEVKFEPTCSTEQSPRSESVLSQESVISACKPSANENESQCKKASAAELPPLCACSPDEGLDSLPISEHVLNTTFCAIAEKLVNQYNARGLDVSEIQQKLRKGFIRSSSDEACRVQNQVLFQVLDEISGQ
ncbi:bZIP transcription factor [Aspergillus foveolatus]|uniref:bZIP transcription factor n=1 Tax=Aspergillus foveolatus TaxID=210207 RepID=UPI003CCE2855